MELLVAMMAGAAGAAAFRRRQALWMMTLPGIAAGSGAWWLLAALGPGLKAGPLLLWHAGAGAIAGGALCALIGVVRARG